MSYWISLNNPNTNEVAQVESFQEGGTQVLGGSNDADLNVTYNYCDKFNFKGLHNRLAKDTIDELQKAVNEFGLNRSNDYWESSYGNVGYTCNILLQWAKQFPEYIWNVN